MIYNKNRHNIQYKLGASNFSFYRTVYTTCMAEDDQRDNKEKQLYKSALENWDDLQFGFFGIFGLISGFWVKLCIFNGLSGNTGC